MENKITNFKMIIICGNINNIFYEAKNPKRKQWGVTHFQFFQFFNLVLVSTDALDSHIYLHIQSNAMFQLKHMRKIWPHTDMYWEKTTVDIFL